MKEQRVSEIRLPCLRGHRPAVNPVLTDEEGDRVITPMSAWRKRDCLLWVESVSSRIAEADARHSGPSHPNQQCANGRSGRILLKNSKFPRRKIFARCESNRECDPLSMRKAVERVQVASSAFSCGTPSIRRPACLIRARIFSTSVKTEFFNRIAEEQTFAAITLNVGSVPKADGLLLWLIRCSTPFGAWSKSGNENAANWA